jgi:CopG family transcriptional regulator/antitoxin EndoAI
MARISKTITISLPPEMASQVEKVMKEEGRTKSELLREALRKYMEDREWKSIFRYGERKAKELGIKPEDVEDLIDEYRAEKKRS